MQTTSPPTSKVSPVHKPMLLTPGIAALSDFRLSFHPTVVTHTLKSSQAPIPQAQCFQGPSTIFTVVLSASRLYNYV